MSEPYWLPISAPSIVTVGTSLPASPTDGQEAILVDNLTNPTYKMRFRYNALSTSAYKWEFIGGDPLTFFIATAISNGAVLNSWFNLTPSTILIPRSGEWELSGGCTVSHPSAGATSYAGIYVGTVSNVGMYSNFGFPSAGGYSGSIYIPPQRFAITAGGVVGMSGQSNFANGNWQFMGWQARPVRVA